MFEYIVWIYAVAFDCVLHSERRTILAHNDDAAIDVAFSDYMYGWVDKDNLRGITVVVQQAGRQVFTMCEGRPLFPAYVTAEALEERWMLNV